MLTFSDPEWLWALVALPILVVGTLWSRTSLGMRRWTVLTAIRCAVLAALIVTLAGPQRVLRTDGVTVIFALDRSRSIPDDLRGQAQAYVQRVAAKARPADRVGIVSFDGRADVDHAPRGLLADTPSFSMAAEPDRTDLAGAVRLALALFPGDTARRLVVLTDGNENQGDVLREIEIASASGVAVDVVPLEYRADDEILLDRLSAPRHASPDSRIELRIVARSLQPARAKLTLYHNNTPVTLSESLIELRGGMQADVATIPVELSEAGVHRFEARITAAEGSRDTIPENNRATAFTIVESRNRVLVLGAPGSIDDQPLVDALQREHVEVVYHGADQVAIDLLALQSYGAVILSNVSADSFTDEQHQALASYVRNLGGGLILLGGNEAFGAGGWAGKPIEEVSPVAFQIPSTRQIPVAALVIVLDRSGSMAAPVGGTSLSQQQVANNAAAAALRTLLSQDYVGLIAFDSVSNWIVPLQRNTDSQAIAKQVKSIAPRGGTDSYPAIGAAAKALDEIGQAASAKHVLLLTDGQMQPAPFETLVERMFRSGITLSTIGVGDAANDPLLRRMAQLGGGVYHPVRNPRLLPQIFFRETRVFRNRLVSEEPFIPRSLGVSPLLRAGAGSFPGLGGYVRTEPKSDAIVALVHPTEGDLPILAHWQYQMGRVIAFTSGWWPRWGEEWLAWDVFGGFWRHAIEWVAGNADMEGFDVATRADGTTGRILVEALERDASFASALTIGGVLVTPRFESRPITLTQTGAGRYEASFDADESGDYVVSLLARGHGQATRVIRTGLSVPYSPEYRELRAALSLLREVSDKTDGKIRSLTDSADDPFAPDLPPVESRRPIWHLILAWFVLPLFILDVAARRLVSSLALSLYVELALLAMLWGVCILVSAGIAGYLAALIVAECVGWALRYRSLRSILDYLVSPVSASVASATQSAAALRESARQVRENLDTQSHAARSPELNLPEPTGQSVTELEVLPDDELVSPPDQTRKQPSVNRELPADTLTGFRKARRRAHARFAEESRQRDPGENPPNKP
ncbi:MAG: VWA domain-containing protein [Phycisphaerae bacterium]|nr:VWA domain-containing protein [Phycisphaerae bacterium]